MLIDGNLVPVTEIEIEEARRQLALPADFLLVQATQQLYHNSGNGMIVIRMPADMFVVGFESRSGNSKFGVVQINSLKHKIKQD
ncbi:hypothetical protein DZC75_20420 [Pseudomonas parafulva]|uniref:Uncharacterized protein n=1 Tax=Pseudomonas parafulva TaxID=157782 RepID=A0AAI8KFJ4_9PSED|nr:MULTISPECIES: hypothetical protein [Pseudomonas]AXO90243.1 hypothetical protein DZC75_20420 [Pseudomonas parafulva]MDV9030504.1 hypothetical protein [Pseudomonas sp. RAC1]